MKDNNYLCDTCKIEIGTDSDFCPRCGTLFIEEVKCEIHSQNDANGVCVICGRPFCDKDGHFVNKVFLCDEHDGFEIYESMAKVFGTSDEIQVQYIKNFLEEDDLHPFIYSRKSSPMHLGGTDYSLFRASGDFDGHIINEIKLMVPFSEVIEALKTLEKFEL